MLISSVAWPAASPAPIGRTRWPRFVAALSGLLFATAARAHGAAAEGVGLIVVGGGLGLIAGIAAAISIASKPGPAGSKALGMGAAVLGLPLLGYALTFMILDAPRQSRNETVRQEQAKYDTSALKRAVCEHDPVGLRREFDKAADTSTLARAVRDCALGDSSARQQETFGLGMQLLATTRGGDRHYAGAPTPDYCGVLASLHGAHQAADLVRRLKGLGLSVSCLDHLGQPIWWTGLNRLQGDAAWVWLQALRDSGVDFGARAQKTGETALDRVVRCHEPRIVRFVLEAAPGVDPRQVSGVAGERPPTAWWILRRFKSLMDDCRLAKAPPEQAADIAAVDARMGELSAEMVNQATVTLPDRAHPLAGTMLWLLHIGTPDPELFAHLLAKGADVQVRNQRGESFLYGITPGRDFLAVLARLPDEQIRRLAQSAPGSNGDVSKPLVEHVRSNPRLGLLVEFLCQRGAQAC